MFHNKNGWKGRIFGGDMELLYLKSVVNVKFGCWIVMPLFTLQLLLIDTLDADYAAITLANDTATTIADCIWFL
jgi:hypothetical protein